MTKPFDPTKPVQTRCGKPARIISIDRKIGEGRSHRQPVVALVATTASYEDVFTYSPDGRFGQAESGPLDLVNVPKREVLPSFLSIWNTDDKRPIEAPIDVTIEDGEIVDVKLRKEVT